MKEEQEMSPPEGGNMKEKQEILPPEGGKIYFCLCGFSRPSATSNQWWWRGISLL